MMVLQEALQMIGLQMRVNNDKRHDR
jgi:hypothetical protein